MINLSDKLSIDPVEYASQGNAILGIRNSGKSYSATYIAEQLMDAGIPIIAFDPIGIWRNLKVGKKGAGYPVVVAGENGDLPLTPQGASDIVRAAMKENISLVVDLYSMKLSKQDWRTIVEQCIRLLLYENKDCGLRHIFIEEAAEFIPQRVQAEQGRVYAEMEKLARMGGNASLGYTLINQRAEEVNKAILENCDCLFLHRQKGRHSLTALGKWLEVADARNGKEITNSLPSLEQGECWVWIQGSHDPVRLKMPEKKTIHPDRKNPLRTSAGISSDVSKFVDVMTTWLVALNGKNSQSLKMPKIIDESDMVTNLQKQLSERDSTIQHLHSIIDRQNEIIFNIKVLVNEPRIPTSESPIGKKVQPVHQLPPSMPKSFNAPGDNGKARLPTGEEKVLIACAQFPNGLTREQITVITGYKLRTRNAYLQALSNKDLVEVKDGRFYPTKEGRKNLGKDFMPLPTGNNLRQYWLNKLPTGESAILATLINSYPKGLSRELISNKTGYSLRTRNAYLQQMAAKEIIKIKNGVVIASENLFD